VLVGIADLAAIINYLGFWLPPDMAFTPMGQALISVGCVLFVLGLNLLTVKLFGEIEFWFALIKILAILGLIVIGGFMVFSHFKHRMVQLQALVMFGRMVVCSLKVAVAF
jgi:D-serine/D-alanine/glycine transporter